MATVNKPDPSKLQTTYEGARIKHIDVELELRRSVLANMLWEDEFYEDGQSNAQRIRELLPKVSPEVVAKLAIQARTDMKLRHVPLLLARELARGSKEARQQVADLLPAIIQRADELTEFAAIYNMEKRQPFSAQVKKGLAAAFTKFSPYDLAKYNRDGAFKLRDVLFLCHAKPKDEKQAETWKKLVDGTLESPDTWEVALSATKSASEKKQEWTRLLSENKLGALALLRNLRNMQEAGVDLSLIRDVLRTAKVERVLPFRFIAASRYAPKLEPELEAAMFRCLEGHESLPGRTALVIDTSPSMWMAKVSSKSDMDRFEAAAALAILLREICKDVNVYAFNNKAYVIPARRGFALRDAIASTKDGYSRGGLAVDMANKDGYDRIIVLTDGEWHYSTPRERQYDVYSHSEQMGDAKVVCPAPLTQRAYMINVSSYRNGVGYGKWTSIDGWSEAIVDYILAGEKGGAL
jgi:60 kDa SS-A/Ro ribonucleoprotein